MNRYKRLPRIYDTATVAPVSFCEGSKKEVRECNLMV